VADYENHGTQAILFGTADAMGALFFCVLLTLVF
jgi:hypothetical protein